MATMTYSDFLAVKVAAARERGAVVDRASLNPCLFPHQRDICEWAIRGGNRAIFASWGLGKTLIQIQILKSILDARDGDGLIVCPLGVKAEFERDARKFFGIDFVYIRTNDEYAERSGQRFFLTNYERVRDGQLDPNRFTVVSLDEASILRSFGSKTYQTFLGLFDAVPFKFVATATPSPNRFKELIHYAGFLGVMDTGQALIRWFKRDSSQAGNLTLHPHKEQEFWLWVSTWATFLTKPSDLSYPDTGYELPPLTIHRHRLPVDHSTAGFDSWGLGWTEKCKDGTKMGVGSPEYILLFRKLPTDRQRSYADRPVVKSKDEYSRSRWQFDASPFWRSRGDRFLSPDEIKDLPQEQLRRLWHEFNSTHVYDFEEHVKIAEELEHRGMLPSSFMLLDPKSHSPCVWDDVARMRTLNTEQARNRVEGHICPLQFDIVERLIETYSNEGDLVLDPFAGIGTVPYMAVSMGRRAYGIELSSEYWADAVGYCRAAEQKVASPTLFDVAPAGSPERSEGVTGLPAEAL